MRAICARSAGLVTLSILALTRIGSSVAAETTGLEGSWSGGGTVRYPSGDTERARCHATFKQRSSSSFGMVARCATASGRVDQTAALRQVGSNRFAGSFKNAEYGIAGSITVILNGSSLHASLSGDNGAGGEFRLSR